MHCNMHFILVGLRFSKLILVVTATDVGGEVVEVESNVKSFKAGDKVVAMLNTLVGQILFICLIFATSLLHFGPWFKPVSEGPAQSLHSFSMDVVIVPCSLPMVQCYLVLFLVYFWGPSPLIQTLLPMGLQYFPTDLNLNRFGWKWRHHG